MVALDDLLADCFARRHPVFEAEFAGWLRASRRLRAFVADNRTKICAKLKSTRDEAGLLDVRAELVAAASLLSDERFTVAYETYAAGKRGGPDFTVVFKTNTRCNVEVRRIRTIEAGAGSAPESATENGTENGKENGAVAVAKLAAVLCDKTRQMPPSSVNFLWLAADGGWAVKEVAAATALLRGRAERKDEVYFARHGFATSGAFLRQYGQMSGVVLWQGGAAALWLNPHARHKPRAELVAALQRLGADKGAK